jgi:hypothetical protein
MNYADSLILRDKSIEILLDQGDEAYQEFIKINPKGKLKRVDYNFLKKWKQQVDRVKHD